MMDSGSVLIRFCFLFVQLDYKFSFQSDRNRHEAHKNEQPNLPQLPSKAPKNSISTTLTDMGNFVSDAGLKLARFLPYLVVIVLTVIALQYVHLKFVKNDGGSTAAEDGKVFVEQILETVTPSSSNKESTNSNEPGLYCSDIKVIQLEQID